MLLGCLDRETWETWEVTMERWIKISKEPKEVGCMYLDPAKVIGVEHWTSQECIVLLTGGHRVTVGLSAGCFLEGIGIHEFNVVEKGVWTVTRVLA
jgi:hypothetical protein